MTDFDDGGGKMTAVEIVSGAENSVFDDLSDVDRAAGDVSIRKIYAAVTSDAADKYLDAGVVVFRPPEDPAVSVLAFSTGDFYDERTALRAKLESGIARGARYMGHLWGPHGIGQRAVMLWVRPDVEIPPVGRRLELVAFSSNTETHSQVIWITRVVDELVTIYDSDGGFQVKSVVCELAEPLRHAYAGTEPTRTDPGTPATIAYQTRYNHDAVTINGIAPLSADADVGDYGLRVASIYSPLIPTAFSETALPDVTPGGDSIALTGTGSGTVTATTALNVVGPSKSLFLGSPVLPGTLTVSVSGASISDSNGVMRLSGLDVGRIDYGAGVIVWNDTCPSYGTATKTLTFRPAAKPLRVADTATQVVTVENRGYVWVITLTPIPQPGTLRVAYRVNNEWYQLTDQGAGQLTGADSSYGTGQINFASGTVTLTTGALPDAESEILYAWSTAVEYLDRTDRAPPALIVRGQTANPNVLPGTVTISWGALTLEDTAGDGILTGAGGEARIVYRTGAWWLEPATIPARGTEITLDYEWGDPAALVEDTWTGPALAESGDLELVLSEAAKPGTLVVTVETTLADYIEQTGEDAEDIPAPAAPLPSAPDTPSPAPPSPAPTTYRLWGTLTNATCAASALSTTVFPSAVAAITAAEAVNAIGTASVSLPGYSSRAEFTVAGVTFTASNPRAIFSGSCALTNWRLRVSPYNG
ncbi:hypothetical protein CKO27_16580 [Thiocystis violacea]|nr:hypothetical protein [Thiocystis violacea]